VADVRRAAATALGELGARQAVEPLRALTADADVEVKKTALRTIARLEA
jgi:HEAT repeat protein